MWFAALIHGLVTEIICYNTPDINNFWQSQTSMIFLGQRFPLYIVLFYPATVSRMSFMNTLPQVLQISLFFCNLYLFVL